jgi:hypothetical protein
MFTGQLVCRYQGSKAYNRKLEERLQHRKTAQRAGLHDAGGVQTEKYATVWLTFGWCSLEGATFISILSYNRAVLHIVLCVRKERISK